MGAGVYLQVTGAEADEPLSAGNILKVGRYANPSLVQHTDYFKSLDDMMQCVEKNVHVTDPAAQEQVCAQEYRNLRLAAFNNKLLYSEVNRRWFIKELEWKKNFSAF